MVWRIALFMVIVYGGFKLYTLLARSVRRGPLEGRVQGETPRQSVNEMVQDPVCGLYVSSDEAVSLLRRGETFYFCSEDCYRRFLEKKG